MEITGGPGTIREIEVGGMGNTPAGGMAHGGKTTMGAGAGGAPLHPALMGILALPAKTKRGRKESECRKARIYSAIDVLSFRISPRPSPPPPIREKSTQPTKPADPPEPAKVEPLEKPAPEPEVELEIPATPPPVEDVIAARRAKRQAIMAKYSGQASLNASPSPMTRNSTEPPASPSLSRAVSQPKEVEHLTPSGAPSVQNAGKPHISATLPIFTGDL